MKTNRQTSDRNPRHERQYALRRDLGYWELTFEGRPAIFKHEVGALYIACLLRDPPSEPMHAVALALKARTVSAEVIQERNLGLDDAETVRALRRRERELEVVLDDEQEIEPVKAEALRELEAIAEFERKNPWRGRDCACRCVRAVRMAIKRLHAHLAGAVDAEGHPHVVLRAFARHLHQHLLIPSGSGGGPGNLRSAATVAGCFTYDPPPGVTWAGRDGLLLR